MGGPELAARERPASRPLHERVDVAVDVVRHGAGAHAGQREREADPEKPGWRVETSRDDSRRERSEHEEQDAPRVGDREIEAQAVREAVNQRAVAFAQHRGSGEPEGQGQVAHGSAGVGLATFTARIANAPNRTARYESVVPAM